MAGASPTCPLNGGQRGRRCRFQNIIVSNFVAYQDRIDTNLLQLFAHPEDSKWFSIIYVVTFEVNVVAEQKQAYCHRSFWQ